MHLLVANSEAEALRLLGTHGVAVLAVGAGISGERALRLNGRAASPPEAEPRVHLVLAGGPDPSLFQDLIDRDRLFYLSQEPVPSSDLIALLRSAVARWQARLRKVDQAEERRISQMRRILGAVQGISVLRKPGPVARATAEAVEDVVRADRGYCLIYDPASETLWGEGAGGLEGEREERRESAAVGLVSFVARTGQPLVLERIGRDPRFDRSADDPQAEGEERFAAVPIRGHDG